MHCEKGAPVRSLAPATWTERELLEEGGGKEIVCDIGMLWR